MMMMKVDDAMLTDGVAAHEDDDVDGKGIRRTWHWKRRRAKKKTAPTAAAAVDGASSSPAVTVSSPKPKRIHICYDFADNKSCDRGADCPYSHDAAEISADLARKKAKVCHAIVKGRVCRKGSECRFSHDAVPIAIASATKSSARVAAKVKAATQSARIAAQAAKQEIKADDTAAAADAQAALPKPVQVAKVASASSSSAVPADLPISTKQVCHSAKEQLQRAHEDFCILCEGLGVKVRVGHHKSAADFLSPLGSVSVALKVRSAAARVFVQTGNLSRPRQSGCAMLITPTFLLTTALILPSSGDSKSGVWVLLGEQTQLRKVTVHSRLEEEDVALLKLQQDVLDVESVGLSLTTNLKHDSRQSHSLALVAHLPLHEAADARRCTVKRGSVGDLQLASRKSLPCAQIDSFTYWPSGDLCEAVDFFPTFGGTSGAAVVDVKGTVVGVHQASEWLKVGQKGLIGQFRPIADPPVLMALRAAGILSGKQSSALAPPGLPDLYDFDKDDYGWVESDDD